MKLFANNCSFGTKRQNTKSHDPQNPQPVEFRQALYFTAKIRNYSQTSSFGPKRQNAKSYDPRNPQPVEFRPIPILLLKYETIRKQL